ncbi:tail fiber domain-containing protein [Velocimicrobium porci]|uniref:Peptidase S74 domain-containing protein n=1 Tax=Velocimicrobium porci TaxID=2606634 RepID=A0A6L5Y189_9FIRM|nr:tail fiber domain-containing protein [Velocimicrobium porci]MSS64607.1 hypothetical protein [Velocimicrobium porci]
MLNVSEEVKKLYRTDYLPQREKNVHKELLIVFPELNLVIENDRIYAESMKITESLCSEEDLTFGSCEAAQFEITIANVGEEINGKEFVVTQILDEKYTMPLGTYVVDSVKKRDDLWFKDITAYDNMLQFDIDVTSWYNTIQLPAKLKDFRQSLCNYVGVKFEEQELPNDDYIITRTLNPQTLIARDVMKAIGEINGMFGHMTRENKFKFIDLSGLGLYPSETLYPANDLFPSEPGEIMRNGSYKSIFYEDYYVKAIDSLTIRNEEGDIGITVGEKTENPYIIQGNFLVYGKSADELRRVAEKTLLRIKNKYYIPHTTTMIGLPYVEVGDSVAIIKETDTIESFVFKRTLTGIQSLTDEISATGNETRENKVALSTQIEQVEGKIRRVTNDIDELSNEMVDSVNGLESKITQTAEQFESNLNDTRNNLQSQISQTAGEIVLKVDYNGKLVQVELGNDASLGSILKLMADNISLEGLTTINGGFKVLLDGTMEAENGIMNQCKFREGIYYRIQYSNGMEQDIPIISSENGQIFWGLKGDENVENVFRRMTRFDDTVHLNAPLLYNGSYIDLDKVKKCVTDVKVGSNNTIVDASISSDGVLHMTTGFRCTFSGTSSSSTPNARVSSGGNVAQTSSSSRRYKENIKPLQDKELDPHKLYEIPIRQYTYKEGYLNRKDERYGKTFLGFIAEEVEERFPLAVDHLEDGRPEMWNINILFPALVKLVQEQKEEIDKLKEQLKQKGVIE